MSGRSEISLRESCNGLPSVFLSFITLLHDVEFVAFMLLKRRANGPNVRPKMGDVRGLYRVVQPFGGRVLSRL